MRSTKLRQIVISNIKGSSHKMITWGRISYFLTTSSISIIRSDYSIYQPVVLVHWHILLRRKDLLPKSKPDLGD